MVTNAGTGLARVVVVAPSRRFAVALPEHLPLALLLPGLVRQAGELNGAHADQSSWMLAGWVLRRADGTALDPDRTLAVQQVKDGEVLHLMPREIVWPEPEYDDVVEAVAAEARAQGEPWRPSATRRAGLTGAAATLLAGVPLIIWSGPPWTASAILALLVGMVLLLVGTALSRAGGDSLAGAVIAGVGLPYLFVGGLLVLADPERALTDLGAPHVLVAGIALLLGGVVGRAGVADSSEVFIAVIICGVAAVTGALIGFTGLDGVESAAAVLALLVLTHPLLPFLSVRLARVPIPPIPQTAEDLRREDTRPSADEVSASVRRGSGLLVGLVLGVSVSSAACLAVTALSESISATVLAAVASSALLLRARIWRSIRLRAPMLLAGGFGAELVLLEWGSRLPGGYTVFVAVPTLLLIATLVAAAGLVFSRRRQASPYLGRFADILDVLLVLSVVPLALAALGLYDSMLNLRQLI